MFSPAINPRRTGQSCNFSALMTAAEDVEAALLADPTAILNESELQAFLQHSLNRILATTPKLTLESDVINRRLGETFTCRRVYRELKATSGRGSFEADLVVLGEGTQTICAKQNGAPARFRPPYAMIIETKIDASPKMILAGRPGRKIAASTLLTDVEKWSGTDASYDVYSVVLTAVPEWYSDLPNVIAIKRPICQCPPRNCNEADSMAAASNYEKAISQVHELYKKEPFWFIREKDFETELFWSLRTVAGLSPEFLNPVRTQCFSAHPELLGKRRRHDLVVLGSDARRLSLEIELKTSHSDTHNWFRKCEVKGEYNSMHSLREAGLLDRALFTLFRYGSPKWLDDAASLSAEFPTVELDYRCSEAA
jgi:hypothetical protein